jgi:hypothetical protein
VPRSRPSNKQVGWEFSAQTQSKPVPRLRCLELLDLLETDNRARSDSGVQKQIEPQDYQKLWTACTPGSRPVRKSQPSDPSFAGLIHCFYSVFPAMSQSPRKVSGFRGHYRLRFETPHVDIRGNLLVTTLEGGRAKWISRVA